MGPEPSLVLPDGLLELKELLEEEWPARRAALRASGVPLCEGDDKDDDDKPDPDKDDDDKPDPDEGLDAAALRAELKKARDEAARRRIEARDAKSRAKELEDKDKTEAQKLEERATTAEQKATKAETEAARLRVALKKGLTEAQAKRLVGETEEDLEADADELLASFKDDTGGSGGSSRPRERLRPGAAPSSEAEETDPAKLAAKVPRMY